MTKTQRDPNIARIVRFAPYRKGAGPTFTLTLWDNLISHDHFGKIRIRYRLTLGRTTLFEGTDFHTPHSSDSDKTVRGIMGFLTLKPGDTDADYFAGYTVEQLAFVQAHAEALACEVEARFPEDR